jgi:hypothetical protein
MSLWYDTSGPSRDTNSIGMVDFWGLTYKERSGEDFYKVKKLTESQGPARRTGDNLVHVRQV